MDVEIGSARAPPTSAQAPQPFQLNRIDTVTDTARAHISFAEIAEKRMARLSRAVCTTQVLLRKMLNDIPIVMYSTRGLPYKRASSEPDAANPIVRRAPAIVLIQKMLLASPRSSSSRWIIASLNPLNPKYLFLPSVWDILFGIFLLIYFRFLLFFFHLA